MKRNSYPPNDFISLAPKKEEGISAIIYQFSHEYCHYLIDSAIKNYEGRFIWLEESLCELASYFVLEKYNKQNLITDKSLSCYINETWNKDAVKMILILNLGFNEPFLYFTITRFDNNMIKITTEVIM
ncbi:MAG: hypothetical protein ACO3EE_03105 [Flavobacteriales bacterium]